MIVSHNTFTYLSPVDWWGWFLIPFSRCQNKDIYDQKFDIADIRLRFSKDSWWVCHGKTKFGKLDQCLKILPVNHVRVLFEEQSDVSTQEYAWLEEHLKKKYPNIIFWTGRRKTDWKKLIDLDDLPNLTQYVGSMAGGLLGKVLPWVWWMFWGKNHMPKNVSGNLSLDFL